MLPRLLALVFLLFAASIAAQVPFYTRLDTAKMREIRTKKIHFEYRLDQPYDSITGQPKKGAHADTISTEYDRMGREIGFSYISDDGSRAISRIGINAKGQVVRRFSYDNDSTNGFLDYWTYNDKGQVVQEISCTREGQKENPFSKQVFAYDDSGNLVAEKFYYIDDYGNTRFDRSSVFYYPKDMEVEITMNEHGDTTFIDSSGTSAYDPYWSRRYRYTGDRGKTRLMLVSETQGTLDTTGDRVTEIYLTRLYDHSTGKLESEYRDTGYYDLQQNMLESRDEQHIYKFFYRPDGSLDYMMEYNRQMQPLFRRTEAFEYYK